MPTLNELLHAASRTFAIGIDLLPVPLRDQVEVAYLLLRVSDFLEDNISMEPARKVELLKLWAGIMDGHDPVEALAREVRENREETPDALVARNLEQIEAAFRTLPEGPRAIVGRHVRDSTLGMARWAERGPDIAKESDLDDYMHEVAGRVGWLLTELFATYVPSVYRRRDQMMMLGREFGLALQTVNVIRGLHSDWERGWVFVPISFVAEHRTLTPHDLFADGSPSRMEAQVLERLVEKAKGHLEAAERYIRLIPRSRHGIRLFCLLPYFFAVRTLAVSRSNPLVFEQETKITRADVKRIVRDSRFMAWSNRWIDWYARKLWIAAPRTL